MVRAVSTRVVARGEDNVAGPLARLHAEAQSSGMALGSLAASVDALENAYRSIVRNLSDNERVLVVAECGTEIVGMAQFVRSSAENARHRAEVQRVAVAVGARGAGVGRQLMEAVENEARERGLTLLWLTTHANTEACAFYESIGYTQLGVMPNYSRRPDGHLAPGTFYYRELA
jgi:ribosomal protein S18 acetylase RimI-like enzyme